MLFENIFSNGFIGGLFGRASGGGVKFLLRDDFSDSVSIPAGSVDGTPAVPSGGNRVVTDTGNNLSVGSSACSIAAGVTWGNPGIYYSSQTRVAGRLLIAKVNSPASYFMVGFDTDTASTMGGSSLNFGAGFAGRIYDQALGAVTLPISADKDYWIGVVLRSQGAYYFVKGEEYTTWTLCGWITRNATATLYPGFITNTGAQVLKSIRIPDELWLPTQLAYDTFTRSNGSLGSTETSGLDGQSISAKVWSDTLGTWAISSNAAICSALSSGVGLATVDGEKSDSYVSAQLTRSAGEQGIIARYIDNDNYLKAFHDGTNVQLVKLIEGIPTVLISTAKTYSSGAELQMYVNGTQCMVVYNNSLVDSIQTISDAELQTGTVCGMYTTDTGNVFDGFVLMEANNYTGLDRYSNP